MSSSDVWRNMGLGRPGRGVLGVLAVLLVVWLVLAVGVNWLGVSQALVLALAGNTDRILSGEIWRLFTAPLLHAPGTVSHLLWTALGFLFLTPRLEERWGTARFVRFVIASSIFAYGAQMGIELLLPASLAQKLVAEYWFGATPTLAAIAVAWALLFKGEKVLLMFVIPVTSTGLIVFIAVVGLLRIVAADVGPEGLLSPFGGMVAGWLFGGTPSPLRRAYLRLRLKQLDREAAGERAGRGGKGRKAAFRVIEGGRSQEADKADKSGPGGRMLH